MEISPRLIVLAIATLLTGLSAGLCFTWTNTVTTGLARLSDLGYLEAFQQMNRTILNPMFFLVFFGPVIAIMISAIQHRPYPSQILWMLIIAFAVYFIAVGLVTIFGNVPINEILDKTDLSSITEVDARSLRALFEDRWSRLHLIRTYASFISFLLLVLVCLWRATPENI